ncbi:reverse transcriptase domain-containing protein [Tanacetum coccineum]
MNEAQKNYTTIEKELLAVVFAFEKLCQYLVLSNTIVLTDHSALRYLFTKQDAKPRLIRWILLLQKLDIEIRDKKGAKNLAADHLSRPEKPDLGKLTRAEIRDLFPEERLMAIFDKNNEPWSVWVVEKFIWIWLGHGFEPWPIVEQKEDKSREHVKVLGMVIGLRDGLLVLGMGLWSIRHADRDSTRHLSCLLPIRRRISVFGNGSSGSRAGHYPCYWRGSMLEGLDTMGSALGDLFFSLQLKALVITFSSLGDGFHTYDGITNTKFYGIVSMLNRGLTLWDLFPLSNRNKYVLVAINYVSKWVEAQAFPTNDARNVVNFLKKLFVRFGISKALISDRGTYFCNHQMEKAMNRYGVVHRFSTVYHPQTNGQVKNTIQAIKCILEKTIGNNRKGWSYKLDDALWAFRTAFKTSLGTTPFRIIYGKACHLPVELEHNAYWAI